jgi:hypothetical protein
MEDTLPRDPAQTRNAIDRYTDYVRLHTRRPKIILIEQERELLKAAIMDFSLSLQEAGALLHRVAEDADVAMESKVEKHIQNFFNEPRSRREELLAFKSGNALSKQRFEQAVDMYQTLTCNALPRDEARMRVKVIAQQMGLKPQADWSQLGSRKWFAGLKPAD